MYGPASVGSGGPSGARPPVIRQMTPRGQMSGGANQRPPLADLVPGMRLMFEPKYAFEYKLPVNTRKKENPPYTGIGSLVQLFEITPSPLNKPSETQEETKERLRANLMRLNEEKNELIISSGAWDPNANPKATSYVYTTLYCTVLYFASLT